MLAVKVVVRVDVQLVRVHVRDRHAAVAIRRDPPDLHEIRIEDRALAVDDNADTWVRESRGSQCRGHERAEDRGANAHYVRHVTGHDPCTPFYGWQTQPVNNSESLDSRDRLGLPATLFTCRRCPASRCCRWSTPSSASP